jgi:hypothetical protein
VTKNKEVVVTLTPGLCRWELAGSVRQAAAARRTSAGQYSKARTRSEPGSACSGPGPSGKPKNHQPEKYLKKLRYLSHLALLVGSSI